MASIACSNSEIACVSDENIAVFTIGTAEKQLLRCGNKQEEKDERANEGSDRVLASGFSNSGQYFAACDDRKQLSLWKSDQSVWQKQSTRSLFRRGTALTFTADESYVLVADKSGDVHRFSVVRPEESGEKQPLMGHVSMLLDLILIDDRFVVTADRDEKVRVSHYPNGYNIQTYCLGHTDYVSRLAYLKEDKILMSGSGDGSLRAWDPLTGEELGRVDCLDHLDRDLLDQGSEDVNDPRDSPHTVRQRLEGSSATWGLEDGLDLKCLACCQTNKLLALGFDKLPVIQLYRVTRGVEGVCVSFQQSLRLPDVLWDVTFTGEGQLLALLASKDCTMCLYTSRKEDDKLQFSVVHENSGGLLFPTIQTVNENWEFFKDSMKIESIFPVLHKVRIDNITEYIQRKMERIVKEKGKKSITQKEAPPGECDQNNGSSNEPDLKKAKLGDS